MASTPTRPRATIVDVARTAGVSRQTVSNVLNSPERVSPTTAERVRLAMETLAFRPNLVARSLRLYRANAIGLEVNSLGGRRLGHVLDEFLIELTTAAGARDAYVVPFAATDHDAPMPAYQDLLASQLVDAFVLTDTRHEDPRPGWLTSHGVPFVAFGRIWDDPTLTRWADVDGYAATQSAVRHLREQGYDRIGFMGWPEGSPVGDDRRAGWREAMPEPALIRSSWQAGATQDVDAGARAAASVIDALGPGGAIVCASDVLALGVIHALAHRGLTPGAQFGVVGFDDSELAEAFGLTSLRQPLRKIATHVLGQVEQVRLGAPPPASGGLFKARLVKRRSTDRSARPGKQP